MVTSLNYFKAKKLIEKHFVKNIPLEKDYQKPKSYYDLNVIDKDSSLKIYKNNQEKVSRACACSISACFFFCSATCFASTAVVMRR